LSPTYSVCKEHGYIAGEHFTCPHCGQKAEVYSRITGYYRPVQNWNEGKTQEYKNRKLYDIKHSILKKAGRAKAQDGENISAKTEAMAANQGAENQGQLRYLFTTKTCPNCEIAKEILEDEDYILVDAQDDVELTKKYGVMQAPTLVVVDGIETTKYVNASNIQRYVDDLL